MAIFVLVHGAWSGAHGFRKVRGPLRAAGHEVFTPSLTGIGERATRDLRCGRSVSAFRYRWAPGGSGWTMVSADC